MGAAMPQKIDELYNKWLGYKKTYYQVSFLAKVTVLCDVPEALLTPLLSHLLAPDATAWESILSQPQA